MNTTPKMLCDRTELRVLILDQFVFTSPKSTSAAILKHHWAAVLNLKTFKELTGT